MKRNTNRVPRPPQSSSVKRARLSTSNSNSSCSDNENDNDDGKIFLESMKAAQIQLEQEKVNVFDISANSSDSSNKDSDSDSDSSHQDSEQQDQTKKTKKTKNSKEPESSDIGSLCSDDFTYPLDEQQLQEFINQNHVSSHQFGDQDSDADPHIDMDIDGQQVGWGSKKRDYYKDNESDSSIDQEKEEEEEAIEMQKRHLSSLSESDFQASRRTLDSSIGKGAALEGDNESVIKVNINALSRTDKIELLERRFPSLESVLETHKFASLRLSKMKAKDDLVACAGAALQVAACSFYMAVCASGDGGLSSKAAVVVREAFGDLVNEVSETVKDVKAVKDVDVKAVALTEKSTQNEERDARESLPLEPLELEGNQEEEQQLQLQQQVQDDSEQEDSDADELEFDLPAYTETIPKTSKFNPPLSSDPKGVVSVFGEGESISVTDWIDKEGQRRDGLFLGGRRGPSRGVEKPKQVLEREQSLRQQEEGVEIDQEAQQEEQLQDPEEDEFMRMLEGRELLKKNKPNAKLNDNYNANSNYNAINDEPPMRDDNINLAADVKRKASRHILVNRGLTPHRKKENRNPRVKKRMKYEGAIKKLSSTRAVSIKSEDRRSRYEGEKTGIKRDLARSVKF